MRVSLHVLGLNPSFSLHDTAEEGSSTVSRKVRRRNDETAGNEPEKNNLYQNLSGLMRGAEGAGEARGESAKYWTRERILTFIVDADDTK